MTLAVDQLAGLLLLAVGLTLVWSAWALVICGAFALVVPEIAAWRKP